ncbi:DMT family transporter [Pseudomonas sp. HK3]
MSLSSSSTLDSQDLNSAHISKPVMPAWQGLLAVVIFSLTAPFTVLALDAFTPEFIAFMRAVVAGLGSIAMIWWFKWPMPKAKDLIWLTAGGAGISLLFPYMLAQSLQNFQATDIGIVLAGLPLVTALVAVGLFKETTTKQFWMSLWAGTLLLFFFAYSQSNGVFHLSLIAMLFAAGVGYAIGGHVAKRLGGFQTICWMMALYLPISLFGMGYNVMDNAQGFRLENISAILALGYLAVMSQWIGFRFWYGSMVKIGIAQTGQLQLLQPFFTLMFAVLLLESTLTVNHVVFACLVTGSVWLVRKSR